MAYDQNAWDDNPQPWQNPQAGPQIQPRPGQYAPGGAAPRPTPLRPQAPRPTPQPNQPPTTSIPDGNGGAVFVPPAPPRTAPWMAPAAPTRPAAGTFVGTGGRTMPITSRTVIDPATGRPMSQDRGSISTEGWTRAPGDIERNADGTAFGRPINAGFDAANGGWSNTQQRQDPRTRYAEWAAVPAGGWKDANGNVMMKAPTAAELAQMKAAADAEDEQDRIRAMSEDDFVAYRRAGLDGRLNSPQSTIVNADGSPMIDYEALEMDRAAEAAGLSPYEQLLQETLASNSGEVPMFMRPNTRTSGSGAASGAGEQPWGQAPGGYGDVGGPRYGTRSPEGFQSFLDSTYGQGASRANMGGSSGYNGGYSKGGYGYSDKATGYDVNATPWGEFGENANLISRQINPETGQRLKFDKEILPTDERYVPGAQILPNGRRIAPAATIKGEANLFTPGTEIGPDGKRLTARGAIGPSGARRTLGASILGGGERLAAGPDIDPTDSERALRLQAMEDEQLGKMVNGPDRYGIAKTKWDDFLKESEADIARQSVDLKRAAAESGFLGSGRLTNQYGDLDERRELNRNLAKSRFLTEALEGSIGDQRYNTGAVGDIAARQLALDASKRGERRTERAWDADVDNTNYARGASERGEQRQERDYTGSVERENIDLASRDRAESRQERGYLDEIDRTNIDLGRADRAETRAERDFRLNADSENQRRLLQARNEDRGERDYLTNIDQINYGRDVADRNETRGERDFIRSVEDSNYQRGAAERAERRTERDAQLGVENLNYERSARERDEGRTERGYQRSLAEAAIARRIQQQAAEQGWSQQEFENALRMYSLGNEGSPEGAYGNAAAIAGQEAAGYSSNAGAIGGGIVQSAMGRRR